MSDPIERQDVIDEAEKWIEAYNSGRGGQRERDAIKHVISGIKKLPPAQPKKRTDKCTETHGVCLDAIDRQVAIDALHDEIVRRRINEDSIDDGALDEFDTEAILRRLPPAQPTGTPLHYNGSDYAHGFAYGYKQGLKDAESERVRCKDCTFYRSDGCFFSTAEIEEDGFCSWAERKTDG